MDFGLSKEQEMIKKEARNFLERECPEELVREIEKGEAGYSPLLWRKIAELGWLGIGIPEEYGGTGGDMVDLVCLYEEMGRAMLPGPSLSTLLCGLVILSAGREEQKSELLSRIAQGDLILALALTEPDAAWSSNVWDAEGIMVPAVADAEEYVIHGTKLFVHDALVADKLVCVVRTGNGQDTEEGISTFLVDTNAPGIRCTPLRTIAGDKQCEVVFDGVRVSQKDMVGPLHGAWPHVARAIQHGAVLLCAMMVGAGEKVLRLTVGHAKTRVQFDAPIGVNQYIQGHCTDLLADVDGCRFVTHQAAWRLSENIPADYEVAVAKAWTSEAFERACFSAHSVFAGYGYTCKDGLLPMYSRRGKTQQLYFGNSRYWFGKVALELEKWTFERARGKPLGFWKTAACEQTPGWEVWDREYLLEV
jgi:alkylation response protein AidB-like acyl-CoA dehydrogenase